MEPGRFGCLGTTRHVGSFFFIILQFIIIVINIVTSYRRRDIVGMERHSSTSLGEWIGRYVRETLGRDVPSTGIDLGSPYETGRGGGVAPDRRQFVSDGIVRSDGSPGRRPFVVDETSVAQITGRL